LASISERIPEPTLRFAFRLVLRWIGDALAPRADGSRKPDTMIAGRAWWFGWLVRALDRITAAIALHLHERAAWRRDGAIGGTGVRIVARAGGEGGSWGGRWCGRRRGGAVRQIDCLTDESIAVIKEAVNRAEYGPSAEPKLEGTVHCGVPILWFTVVTDRG